MTARPNDAPATAESGDPNARDPGLAGDVGEALIERFVTRLDADPGGFESAAGATGTPGLDPARLDELALEHFHAPVADLVDRARIDAAAHALLQGDAAPRSDRFGFGTREAFEAAFERRMAMSPAAYRDIPTGHLDLHLPPDYPIASILAYLGRDPTSPSERVSGDRYAVAFRLRDRPVAVTVTFRPGIASCRVLGPPPSGPEAAVIHERLVGRLGLALDPGPFEARVRRSPELASLVEGRAGLRIPLVADPFDALVWVIAGQQVSLAAAFSMRRRLIEAVGRPVDGLVAPPTAADVARLDEAALGALGFSRAKSRALGEASRAIVDGRLDLDALTRASATRIERTLLALRGLGPWSVNYMLMRGYGFGDCVPIGDSALGEGLKRFFRLGARPDVRTTLSLMAPFRPFRSLATFHLWRVSAGGG